MNKTYINLDKVQAISLILESNIDRYNWYEKVPERTKKLFGFVIKTLPAVPAGWSEYDESHKFNYTLRREKSYFDQYTWYKVNEITKQISHKPYVEIRFSHNSSITKQFETNEDAQTWIDDLLSNSPKKFQVIIK